MNVVERLRHYAATDPEIAFLPATRDSQKLHADLDKEQVEITLQVSPNSDIELAPDQFWLINGQELVRSLRLLAIGSSNRIRLAGIFGSLAHGEAVSPTLTRVADVVRLAGIFGSLAHGEAAAPTLTLAADVVRLAGIFGSLAHGEATGPVLVVEQLQNGQQMWRVERGFFLTKPRRATRGDDVVVIDEAFIAKPGRTRRTTLSADLDRNQTTLGLSAPLDPRFHGFLQINEREIVRITANDDGDSPNVLRGQGGTQADTANEGDAVQVLSREPATAAYRSVQPRGMERPQEFPSLVYRMIGGIRQPETFQPPGPLQYYRVRVDVYAASKQNFVHAAGSLVCSRIFERLLNNLEDDRVLTRVLWESETYNGELGAYQSTKALQLLEGAQDGTATY